MQTVSTFILREFDPGEPSHRYGDGSHRDFGFDQPISKSAQTPDMIRRPRLADPRSAPCSGSPIRSIPNDLRSRKPLAIGAACTEFERGALKGTFRAPPGRSPRYFIKLKRRNDRFTFYVDRRASAPPHPLLALSGHSKIGNQCSLLWVKRTCRSHC